MRSNLIGSLAETAGGCHCRWPPATKSRDAAPVRPRKWTARRAHRCRTPTGKEQALGPSPESAGFGTGDRVSPPCAPPGRPFNRPRRHADRRHRAGWLLGLPRRAISLSCAMGISPPRCPAPPISSPFRATAPFWLSRGAELLHYSNGALSPVPFRIPPAKEPGGKGAETDTSIRALRGSRRHPLSRHLNCSRRSLSPIRSTGLEVRRGWPAHKPDTPSL